MALIGQWLIIALALAGVFVLFLSQAPNSRNRWFASLFLATGVGLVWGWQAHLHHKLQSAASVTVPHLGRADGYSSSDSCRACHPDQYSSWHRSFHRTMTQVASPESVRGNFEKIDLEFEGDRYRLERRGTEFWVELVDPDWRIQQESGVAAGQPELVRATAAPRVWRRVSMVTGSHYMQAYWIDNQHGNQQLSLPFTYLFEQERWAPRPAVLLRDPAKTGWAQVWNLGCVDCHSTAGQPGKLPAKASFDTRVAELGIACEACHGPAAEHVRLNADPRRRYQMHLAAKGDPSIVNPARLSSKRSSEVCGRCHSVHSPLDEEEWLQHGSSFRAGQELEKTTQVSRHVKVLELRRGLFWSDDMIRVSGREYNGLVKSPCFQKGEMSCLSCHSLHRSEPTYHVAKTMDGNAACLQCHKKFATNLQQHTHHAPASTGSLCYNCHMPYTTYGLMKGLRSHQISSPSVKTALQTGRPDACNLCHLDKTLAWTGQMLHEWYQAPEEDLSSEDRSTPASVLWATKGDAGQRALIAWHMGWEPARAVSGNGWFVPYLAMMLEDPYPVVRYIAARSLRRQSGFQQINYDYVAAPEALHQASQSALAQWAAGAHPQAGTSRLIQPDGRLDQSVVTTLLRGRNNRPMDLNE
jgi:predicted CXXCH cytochrome family protein